VDAHDSLERKDVPSTKKLLQDDAYLVTRKNVLGWIIDTVRGTLELPLHHLQRLLEIFDTLQGRWCVGIAEWHQVLGELWSMTLMIPGS
jgi:chemotaxis signal transduction protein